MRHLTISTISPLLILLVSTNALAATPTDWVTTYDPAFYSGTGGTVTFNDWGYKGPTGVGANDFVVTSPVTGITGFDSSRVGQRQEVLTLDPDWKTRDAAITSTMAEFGPTTVRPNTSQDAQVNFFHWTYTTVGGSTFNNMQIDKAGNYQVAKNDMNFQFYDTFNYHDTTGAANNSTIIDSNINFKPYASSDATGWCGSVLTGPNALEVMAGQVKFDLSMDVYMGNARQSLAGGITQIIPDFVMRSYGSYVVNLDRDQYYTGSAVMNNNNPEINPLDANGEVSGAALDAAYKNRVSFLGAGLIPKGVWLKANSYLSPGVKNLNADGTWNYTIAGKDTQQLCDPYNSALSASPEAGAVCYGNFFAGYAFLMRADGQRTLTYVDPTGHSDYAIASLAAVPVPAAAWLLGSGLIGLLGMARRRMPS
ncbi:hypothetical protein SCD_n01310 [Sulfuricella denitrificans skB26]|uniref:Uncharacterized protein n=1 Tax=Sulfuricella denitrificans (strain DSM 22764 / NBRC 105220 / skB26) TaxID=1163617 RepID=S6B3B0_SULDS|nr:VPLPA-CTERM sorting domain-containing protein [Sulfuricella denitrificans]BAN35137.1 hypothetical protein SCD_n01310 [Sulfuricella denitrificans skB26]